MFQSSGRNFERQAHIAAAQQTGSVNKVSKFIEQSGYKHVKSSPTYKKFDQNFCYVQKFLGVKHIYKVVQIWPGLICM